MTDEQNGQVDGVDPAATEDDDGRLVARKADAPAHEDPHGRFRLNRRRFLASGAATGVAASAIALPLTRAQDSTPPATPADQPAEAVTQAASTGSQGEGMAGMDMTAAPNTNQGFTFFVPYQSAIIEAAAARLIPTDDLGPGATEAGVVYFIDRQITSQKSYRGPRYTAGPYVGGQATQGDQSGLPLRDRFRLGIFGMDNYAKATFGNGFAALSPDQQDQVLTAMDTGQITGDFGVSEVNTTPSAGMPAGVEPAAQAGIGAKAFFDLLLSFTIAGFFADPVQGGNRDMVGWKLIGFPGAHIGYPNDIENYGQPFQGDFISLGQYQQQMTGGGD